MNFGIASKIFGARSYVLRECRLDADAAVPVLLVGRRGGLLGWFRALIGLDDTVTLGISAEGVTVDRTSLSGRLGESVPMSAVSNLGAGYLKPIGFLLIALLTLPLVGDLFQRLLETSDVAERVLFAWRLAGSVVGFVGLVAAYFLRKCVIVHVIADSGFGVEVAFSRSLVEGVAMDAATGEWIMDAVMSLKFGRPVSPLPVRAPGLSADRSRTGFVLWVAVLSAIGLGGALAWGWLRHAADEGLRSMRTEAFETARKTVVERVSERVVEPKAEPEKKPVAEPKTEPVKKPVVEPKTEPVKKPVAEPEDKPVQKPEDEPMTRAVRALKAGNYPKALEEFGKASEEGQPLAFNALGQMFRNGMGVDAGPEAAIVFFRAALADVPDANAALAECFENGYGVRRNPLVARSYYRRAMECGYRGAKAKVDGLAKAIVGADPQVAQRMAREDLEKALKACVGCRYPPLEAAVKAVRVRLEASGIR